MNCALKWVFSDETLVQDWIGKCEPFKSAPLQGPILIFVLSRNSTLKYRITIWCCNHTSSKSQPKFLKSYTILYRYSHPQTCLLGMPNAGSVNGVRPIMFLNPFVPIFLRQRMNAGRSCGAKQIKYQRWSPNERMNELCPSKSVFFVYNVHWACFNGQLKFLTTD